MTPIIGSASCTRRQQPQSDDEDLVDLEVANLTDNGGYGIVIAKPSRALLEATFECGSVPGRTVGKLDGSVEGLKDPLKDL